MKTDFSLVVSILLGLLLTAGVSAPVAADEEQGGEVDVPAPAEGGESTDERLDTLERAVEVLSREQDRLRTAVAVPEGEELRSVYGLGPAASKVYLKERGLSIGGYGEWRGRFYVDDNVADLQNELDALRAVLYFGYKFNDWIVMNSEFEFEHAGTSGGGSASVEFLTLDFLFDPRLSARAGLLLIPMGLINEMHEPTTFYGAARPEVERRIIPTTFRENGLGVMGEWGPVAYRAYGVNGLDAAGFSVNGFRGGRQQGSEALAENWAFTGRVDVTPLTGLLVGASVWVGKSGQNGTDPSPADGGTGLPYPDALTTIWEVHSIFSRWGATLRGLYAQSHLDDAAALSRALGLAPNMGVAKKMNGGYITFAYDVLFWLDTRMTLEPFYRYERLNTQKEAASGFVANPSFDRRLHVVGLQYKPIPQVVIKLDYRNIASEAAPIADEVQLGFGYIF